MLAYRRNTRHGTASSGSSLSAESCHFCGRERPRIERPGVHGGPCKIDRFGKERDRPGGACTVLSSIEPEFGTPIAPNILAAAACVRLSTVHRGGRILQTHRLADIGHGWIARTGRAPGRIDAAHEGHRLREGGRRLCRHQGISQCGMSGSDHLARERRRSESAGCVEDADAAALARYWV